MAYNELCVRVNSATPIYKLINLAMVCTRLGRDLFITRSRALFQLTTRHTVNLLSHLDHLLSAVRLSHGRDRDRDARTNE